MKAQSENKNLTEGLKALTKSKFANQVLTISQADFPYPETSEVKYLNSLFVRNSYMEMFD